MRLDDCYRLLDLDRRASTDEIKRAHRDLTKVWHPDRFGHDADLRRKAEEKLKAINEAYETIRASHGEFDGAPDDAKGTAPWRVRWRSHESAVGDLAAVVTLVERGAIGEDSELFDPAAGRWAPLAAFPELHAIVTRRRARRNRGYALTCAGVAVLVLLRRPSPAGLAIALVLFVAAGIFIARLRMSGAGRRK